MLQERRIYPRVPCQLPAELETSTGELIDVSVVNISRSGLHVEGGPELTGLQPPRGLGATEIWLHFGLDQQALHCHCRIVYKRRNAHDNIGLGLHLVSTDAVTLRVIEEYVRQHLQ